MGYQPNKLNRIKLIFMRRHRNFPFPFYLFSLLSGLIFNPLSYAQNLLLDGGFEQLAIESCRTPSQGFNQLKYWYLLDATPDLFIGGCSFNEQDFGFWHESTRPYEGNNYVGIWSRWNSNSTYFSEGIATSLTQALSARTYYFEIAIQNQGELQGFDDSIATCALHPEKHIDLYLQQDSIFIDNNFSNGTASTNATMVATLNSGDIQNRDPGNWTLVSTCFEAKGGEQFLGIVMPLGTFGELPPCASNAGSGVFRSFYYNLDAAFLAEMPEQLEREITTCENQDFEVSLTELFDFALLEKATFLWEDGVEGDFRRLSATGTYTISAELGCGSIPLTLEVLPENCQSIMYVPNAFSPNSDGINDTFRPYFSNDNEPLNFQMTIYDRWGAILFQTNNPNLGWAGSSQNQEIKAGMYTWVISFETQTLDETKKKLESGHILLVK